MGSKMAKATIDQLEGGAALCTWFGGIPSFHDTPLRELELRQGAPSRLVVYAFNTEAELDAEGYIVPTKHVVITLTMFDLIEVELFEFMPTGTMDGLAIDIDDDGVTISLEASFGVHGRIKAKRIDVSFAPDESTLDQKPQADQGSSIGQHKI
jgi:hypothetical protein